MAGLSLSSAMSLSLSPRGAGGAGPSMAITASSVPENALSGSTVGVLSVVGGSGTYTFTKTADPDAKFVVSGSNLNTAAALDYETATSHSVTISASNGVDAPVVRTFTIAVTNVFEQPSLSALTLPGSITTGATVAITGATTGSTITGTLPAGWSVNSGARTVTVGAVATGQAWTLVETLADSANSPRTSTGTSDVVAGSSPVSIPTYTSGVFIGDSLTAGTGASSSALSWVGRFGTLWGITPLNQGVGGTVLQSSADTTGVSRADNGKDYYGQRALGSNKKDAVFVAYGFNDARYVANPSAFNVTEYINRYREVVQGLLEGGYAPADIYVIAPYYITDTGLVTGSGGFSGQTRVGFEAFVAAVSQIANEFGVRYHDAYAYGLANGFAATTTVDNIHPNDTGHGIIFTGITTQTFEGNSLGRPATVSASLLGTTVTVTADAVAGAVSYEYALTRKTTEAAINTTGVFTSINGTVRARARAVFSGGNKGPWRLAATDTIAPQMYFVASAVGTNTATMPAHEPGDLLIVLASRTGSSTLPTLVAGWTSITSNNASSMGWRCAKRIALTSAETVGTWTNSDQLIVLVYRGYAHSLLQANATSTAAGGGTISFPALTLGASDSSRQVIGLAGARTVSGTVEVPPSGMTLRTSTSAGIGEVAAFDTNGGVASWAGGTGGDALAANWKTLVIEMVADAP